MSYLIVESRCSGCHNGVWPVGATTLGQRVLRDTGALWCHSGALAVRTLVWHSGGLTVGALGRHSGL